MSRFDRFWGYTTLRSLLAPLVWQFIIEFWAIGFQLAGHLFRPRIRYWRSSGGKTVLALAPHPDDEVAGCGASLLHHRRVGDRVVIVYVTDGRAARACGVSPDEVARLRACEARVVADALDAELEWLGLRELEWPAASLTERLQDILDRVRPDVIYSPSAVDWHPEHCKVAAALAAALLIEPSGPVIRIYPIQVPLTPLLVNLISPVGTMARRRQTVLAAYESQRSIVLSLERLRRYNRAFWGAEVECFGELSASEFARVTALGDRLWTAGSFRRIGRRPVLDPLCYLQGWTVRRRIASIYRRSACLPGTAGRPAL